MSNESECPWWNHCEPDELLALLPFANDKGFGCVYALQWGDEIKIGYTTTPKARLQQHIANAKIYGKTVIESATFSEPHRHYLKTEKELHAAFSQFRQEGEFFSIEMADFLTAARDIVGTQHEALQAYCPQPRSRTGIHLTDAIVRGLPRPAKGRVRIQDTKQPGLVVAVTAAGSKVFYVIKRQAGKLHEVRIGPCESMSVTAARIQAREILISLPR